MIFASKKHSKTDKNNQTVSIEPFFGFWSKNEQLQNDNKFKEPTIEKFQNSEEPSSVDKIQKNNELDINISEENEKVLEIPAFLRRQAN